MLDDPPRRATLGFMWLRAFLGRIVVASGSFVWTQALSGRSLVGNVLIAAVKEHALPVCVNMLSKMHTIVEDGL